MPLIMVTVTVTIAVTVSERDRDRVPLPGCGGASLVVGNSDDQSCGVKPLSRDAFLVHPM
jgi:hypothetical protein